MKLMFVVGGSYKGFYVNQIKNIKNIDLLVFHQDIFYELDYAKSSSNIKSIFNELIGLNSYLKCPILVLDSIKNKAESKNVFILCNHKKVSIINSVKDIYLPIKKKYILIGNKYYKTSQTFATISIVKERCTLINDKIKYPKNYFICDKKGVTYIKGNKIYRKFRKYCYFTLRF